MNDKVDIRNGSLRVNEKNNEDDKNRVWGRRNEELKLCGDYELDNSIKEGERLSTKHGD